MGKAIPSWQRRLSGSLLHLGAGESKVKDVAEEGAGCQEPLKYRVPKGTKAVRKERAWQGKALHSGGREEKDLSITEKQQIIFEIS